VDACPSSLSEDCGLYPATCHAHGDKKECRRRASMLAQIPSDTKICDTWYPRAELPDTGAYDDSIAGRNSGLIGGDGDAARICHHHKH
jgi:hypothetical protein